MCQAISQRAQQQHPFESLLTLTTYHTRDKTSTIDHPISLYTLSPSTATPATMPRALSTITRARIKADLAAGHDIKTIMSTHAISDKKARAMKKLYDNCGEVWLPKKKGARTGRPPKITPEHEERLRSYLADHPDAYIKDMCKFLEAACGILVDDSTMWRAVQRLGWQAQRLPKPRDERGFWVQTLPRDEAGNVVTNNASKRTPGMKQKQKQRRGGGEPSQNLSRGMTKQLLAKTREFVQNYMAQAHFDASHDYAHVQRVLALSMEIQRVEQRKYKHVKFDDTITELVALMHDIDDHKYRQQPAPLPLPPTTQTHISSSLPSPPSNMDPQYPTTTNTTPIDPTLHPAPTIPPTPAIETHLITLGWPPHIAITVSIISASVSFTTETQHPNIHLSALRRFPELAIVQDADRLDALGAIGIGRAFAYAGAKGRGFGETMGHFEEKLGRLEGMMKTGEGRRMARERSERVGVFRGWWGEEMEAVGAGVQGNGEVGVGDEVGRVGDGDARAGLEDPGRQLIRTIEDVDEGSSGDDGSSSDSE